jgi:hypothetical protein
MQESSCPFRPDGFIPFTFLSCFPLSETRLIDIKIWSGVKFF